jgi:hypothetical protein
MVPLNIGDNLVRKGLEKGLVKDLVNDLGQG